jgi:Protein of unknown function (DUF3089)
MASVRIASFLRAGLCAPVFLVGCAVPPPAQSPPPPATLRAPFTGYKSARYSDPRWWLCLPGRTDACAADLDATDVLPDRTRVEVRDHAAPGRDDVDCFYVYPTVDLRFWPASHTNFSDPGAIARVATDQAARFRYACRVFAPFYRQTTIGTYLQSAEKRRPYREVALSDVVDAFLHYMGQYNGGRRIVIVGHSQGSEMVVELLKRFFDDDPAMREKLLLALPIGWPLDVKPGQTTGGTFAHIPQCTERGETGCVVTFRTYPDGETVNAGNGVPPPGRESMCVNPAELAHGTSRFTRAFFPRSADGIRTPFVLVRDFYEARCKDGPGGLRYLAVSVARPTGDTRVSPVDMGFFLFHGEYGYHVLDMQFAQGDLVDLVAERAAALTR